jgi:hypothetical protein
MSVVGPRDTRTHTEGKEIIMTETILRHATLEELATALNDQSARTVDLKVPGKDLNYRDGMIWVQGQPLITLPEPVVTSSGVTTQIDPNGAYRPTTHGDGTIAAALDIPTKYVRRLRDGGRTDLLDANIRGLLRGKYRNVNGETIQLHAPDARSFLLRLFTAYTDAEGVRHDGALRAMLSGHYGIVDNLDVLSAVLDGVRKAEVTAEVREANLTDTRMSVRLVAPEVTALAPTLLGGYRNPWDNANLAGQRPGIAQDLRRWSELSRTYGLTMEPGREPVVSAGLVFSNSEVGSGAFNLSYQITALVCNNGMTTQINLRKIHLGGELEDGIQWTRDTQRKSLDLLTAKVRDAVAEWMTPAFLASQVAEIEKAAGAPVENAEAAISAVAKRYGFTETERAGVLAHFMVGGQATKAGIANAITSYSQTAANPERQDELDSIAISAMTV